MLRLHRASLICFAVDPPAQGDPKSAFGLHPDLWHQNGRGGGKPNEGFDYKLMEGKTLAASCITGKIYAPSIGGRDDPE